MGPSEANCLAAKIDPIVVNNLGIRFRDYGGVKKRPSMRRRIVSRLQGKSSIFWALDGVTFNVQRGDVLCVIGRNGAGKTTLLKVLARILAPDTGSLVLDGEASAFLSMGLGFQRELNGYENINLSLAFKGLNRDQINAVVPSIEDFSKLGNYLNAPVKIYSAGMMARLAFSIATCVEPDLLIMDEVISAGDEEFRQRSAQRVRELLQSARAVVFATHNMQQVHNLASKVLWIEKGKVCYHGDPVDGVRLYQEFIENVRNDPFFDLKGS